jgi:predicted N-acyltransferase
VGKQLELQAFDSLASIPRAEWEALRRDDYPFLGHDFLLGLETSGCTTADNGWQPCHFRLSEGGRTLALLPAYLKSHSYGEYVFDWSWADAWRRVGLDYYPKLLTAIPFTPATGPRLLYDPALAEVDAWQMLLPPITDWLQTRGLSSWHILFPEAEVAGRLHAHGLHRRSAVQFHWFNRGYTSFDDFLGTFASRKRKALRRERRRVEEQGVTLRTLAGEEIRAADWERFYHFYQMTYAKRSGHGGYLTREFFLQTAPSLGDQVILVMASAGGEDIAGALFFRGNDTLFGRYWGCLREYDCLHFEACYYQGIDFCIREGISRFDPGAQGEHKIQRGFEPVQTVSSHWIGHPALSSAVGDFTEREQPHIEAYAREAATLLPFRQGED